MNETAQLAKFTAEMEFDKLPTQAVLMAKQCLLDWLGVALRGAHEEPARILRETALKMCGTGESTVFDGGSRRVDPVSAALVNGAASHTLDFDDLHNPSIIHLATVVIPAAVAVASASLLGLDAQQTNMCLGSAGTQAAGLWEFLKEGAMSKALHAGRAASAGVFSAYLAQSGFTAASKILEGEKGFCPALSEAPRIEKITQNLSYNDLKIQHNSFKPYACCKHAHAAVYGAQTLRSSHGIKPEDIDCVEIKVNNITDFLINNPAPQNVYGCKFSIQYCVAAALVYGKAGVDEFNAQARSSTVMQKMMDKITVVKDEKQELLNRENPAKLASEIIIKMKDGVKYQMQVDYPKGDPDNPMTWEESNAKFIALAEPVCGRRKAEKLSAYIKNIDEISDITAEFKKIF